MSKGDDFPLGFVMGLVVTFIVMLAVNMVADAAMENYEGTPMSALLGTILTLIIRAYLRARSEEPDDG